MRDYEYRNMNGVNGVYGSDDDWQMRRWREPSYGPAYRSQNEYWSEQPQPRYGYGFAGKGPKGYMRSDERIKEDVCEKLYWHPEIDASDMEVNVKAGDVVLTGKVPDRRSKRLAEDLAESVTGVKDVSNGLRLARGIHSEIVSTTKSGNGHRTRNHR